ncbi:MAG: FkbM family methyltransferase [Flavobacteriales bacterium]|nr:MAG: FkbM family methyltransferase [Flavobacteriales bacterium]
MSSARDHLLQKLFVRRKPEVVMDIGACNGYAGVHYGHMFPGAVVHAFEPVPTNHALVLANATKHPEVDLRAHCLALSDRAGRAVLHLSSAEGSRRSDGHRSSSLLEPGLTTKVHPWLEFKQRIEVTTDTLDAFCARERIAAIDLIHMDVQGAELMVLRGAPVMLKKVKAIWMEVERVQLYKGQPVKREVEAFMRANGFVLTISSVDHIAGDQLWVSRTFLEEQPHSLQWQVTLGRWWGAVRMSAITALGALRYRVQLRTRLRTMLKALRLSA